MPRPLLLIFLFYLLTALAYGVINPLFEGPDEHLHYFTAHEIAETGRLPSVPQPAVKWSFVPTKPGDWQGPEAAQPPLYYLLAGLLITPFDLSQAQSETIFNPLVRLGDGSQPLNRNAFIHLKEGWPWSSFVASVHLLRAFSAVVGLGTLIFIYQSGRLLWPNHPTRPVLAVGLVASLPQFSFQHSLVSNDVLITFWATLTLYQLLRVAHNPAAPLSAYLWLGVTIGLAALSKTQGVVLLAYALLFLMVVLWPHLQWQQLGKNLAAVLLPAVTLAGWLWVRNWWLYDDPTAANQFVLLAGGERSYTLTQVFWESGSLWRSLFATFGWFNVLAPSWVHWLWSGVVGAAGVGLLIGLWQNKNSSWRQWAVPVLLLLWLGLVYSALVAFMLQTPAAQGRLLFPALLPCALGLAYGLSYLPTRPERWLWPLLGLVNLYCLLVVIPAAFAPPRPLMPEQIPPTATVINQPLAPGLLLQAAEIDPAPRLAGEMLPLTLYWHKSEPFTTRPQVVIELFSANQQLLGKSQSYHGRGLAPADMWPVGLIQQEETFVPVGLVEDQPQPLDLPTVAHIFVRLADGSTAAEVGQVALHPAGWPPLASQTLAQIEPGMEIVSAGFPEVVTAGQSFTVMVEWQVTQDIDRAYTAFVHLGEPGQPPVAQGDGVPRQGHYPTMFWQAGQRFTDEYVVTIPADLPPGRYPVQLGLYESAAPHGRLPLSVNGVRQPFEALVVGVVVVE